MDSTSTTGQYSARTTSPLAGSQPTTTSGPATISGSAIAPTASPAT